MFVPNAIDRVLVLVELKMPVVRSNPPRSRVPLVNVVWPVAINASADPSVAVPVVLMISVGIVRPLLVRVPVPTMFGIKVVYVPLLDNVRLPTMNTFVAVGSNDVVPKVKFLNQLLLVRLATEAPVVNVKFGAFVVDPPVVPN